MNYFDFIDSDFEDDSSFDSKGQISNISVSKS
jgi:hypothetical protein